MKILLLYPEDDEYGWSIQFRSQWNDLPDYSAEKFYPMATACLGSVLLHEGHEVRTSINIPAPAFKNHFVNEVREFKPDIVALTCLSTNRLSVYDALNFLQTLKDDKPIVVLGGIHATYLARQLLTSFPAIDYILKGECDLTFPQLLKAIKEGYQIDDIVGLGYRKNKQVYISDQSAFVKDLDSLPWPAHHLFKNIITKWRTANILATRGCPCNCLFCCQLPNWSHNQRYRHYQSVADEMEYLYRKYDLKFLRFADETFTANKKWVIEFCKSVKKKKINLPWFSRTMISFLDDEICSYLEEANCFSLVVGIETGNYDISKNIDKPLEQEKVIEVCQCMVDHKIRPVTSFTIGNPGENFSSILDTLKLIRKIKIWKIKVYTTSIAVGSRLWKFATNDIHYIEDSYWLGKGPCPLYTVEKPEFILNFYRVLVIVWYCICKKRLKSFINFCYCFIGFFVILLLQRVMPHKKVYIKWKKIHLD